jgi:hypothetical protein
LRNHWAKVKEIADVAAGEIDDDEDLGGKEG